jgi:hypothetical protein
VGGHRSAPARPTQPDLLRLGDPYPAVDRARSGGHQRAPIPGRVPPPRAASVRCRARVRRVSQGEPFLPGAQPPTRPAPPHPNLVRQMAHATRQPDMTATRQKRTCHLADGQDRWRCLVQRSRANRQPSPGTKRSSFRWDSTGSAGRVGLTASEPAGSASGGGGSRRRLPGPYTGRQARWRGLARPEPVKVATCVALR